MEVFTRALTSALIALMVRNGAGRLPQVDTTKMVDNEPPAVSLQDESQHTFEETITIDSLRFSFSDVDSDGILQNASDSVTNFSLYYCPFVSDLSYLPSA